MLDLCRIFHVNVKQRKSIFHKFLITCNYIFGRIIGNKHFAIKCYYKTTIEIIDFCNAKANAQEFLDNEEITEETFYASVKEQLEGTDTDFLII